jgi:hypothetical protein
MASGLSRTDQITFCDEAKTWKRTEIDAAALSAGVQGGIKYYPKRIAGEQKIDEVCYYLVHWHGYKGHPTWEPADTMIEDVPLLVQKFLDN